MFLSPALVPILFAAVETAGSITAREFDWPDTGWGWLTLIVGSALVMLWVTVLYARDSVELPRGVGYFLASLRLIVLGGLLIIALNPQDRTQRTAFRPSRVALLVDTSLSMRHPTTSPQSDSAATLSRMDAVRKTLIDSPLIERLQRDHEVSIYGFDGALTGPLRVFPFRAASSNSAARGDITAPNSPREGSDAWKSSLEPRGTETRLGESLAELIRQTSGRTLSGIVVFTDGGQNAGADAVSAHDRAVATKSRLLAVGYGSVEQPINVQIADVQSPTDVQIGDKFDMAVFIQSQGLAGRAVTVELLAQPAGETGTPTSIAKNELQLAEDGVPGETRFSLKLDAPGEWQYTVRVQPQVPVTEFNADDNQQTFSLRVFDRPTKVLLFAGGPMRDYQFVRNLLYRHKSIDVDVLLQTAAVGSSQESNKLLLQFPTTREELFEYDVVVAFDPDWRLVPKESIQLLSDWVYQEGGGLLLVAGDVNTLQLAAASEQATPLQEQLQPLRELYPVVLSSYVAELQFDQSSTQAWPIEFSPEGQRSEFLQLTDDPVTSLARWKEFPGFYRCYPTSGAKAGATVLARFTDPRTQNEFGFPVLMAGQFFGQGRTLYIGAGETWRLRSVSDADYDRLWIKLVRELSQGRTKRGTKRGVLLPESRKLTLGQTARIRARLLDSQLRPLDAAMVTLDVIDPTGRPIVPSPRLQRDQSRPGEFLGDFRASLPGSYRLDLAVPESSDHIADEVTVSLPKLEDQDVRLNVNLLNELVRDTGGQVLSDEKVLEQLPGLLPPRGEPFTIDERLRSLWDREWVMYVLVSVLSLEWLIRKLLKLA